MRIATQLHGIFPAHFFLPKITNFNQLGVRLFYAIFVLTWPEHEAKLFQRKKPLNLLALHPNSEDLFTRL